MRTNERRVSIAAVAAIVSSLAAGAPGMAWAQGSGAGSAEAAMTDEARKLYDQGRKAKEKGDHATCVAKLRAAWALVQHRQVAGLLGECELRTGAKREATEHLAYFLDQAGDAPPEAVAAVRALYDEARAEVAVVTVKASVDGADRKVDGRPLAPEERRVFLAPGEHVFAASKPGAGAGEKKIFVSGGQEREVVVELAADAAAPAPGPTPEPYRPPAAPPEETRDGPSLVPGLVVGGVGLVGVGVGVGLLVAAGGAGSDAETKAAGIKGEGGLCDPITPGFEQPCGSFQDSLDQEATLRTGAAIALIGGGVLLAGGVGWTIWAATSEGDEPAAARVRLTPDLGPGGGALRLHGAF